MDKPLENMSFEELGRLFPIIICEHNPAWRELYSTEKVIIEQAAGSADIVRINHYGSTFVPGLCAKPTIDILLEIRDETDTHRLIDCLKGIGYLYTPQPKNPPPHMMFMKGYAPHGFEGQAYHVHVRYKGDWDELYFRDYLVSHPETAREYGELKLKLKEKYEHDREAYTESKTEFIKAVTRKAREESGLYTSSYANKFATEY